MADSHVHVVNKRWDVKLYGPPNKVLGGILMGDGVAKVVGDYTQKVASTYQSMAMARATPKAERIKKKRPPQNLYETTRARMNPNDGYRKDRWVGEVVVGDPNHPYAQADEFGRNQYAAYRGSGQLEDALRMHLPHRP